MPKLSEKDMADMNLPVKKDKDKRGYERLFDLGAERLAVIDMMLIKGTAMSAVQKIQDEWGLHTDIASASFERQLVRYRTKFLDGRLSLALTRTEKNPVASKQLQKFHEQMDVLEEFYDLIDVQKERIRKQMLQEAKLPTLMGGIKDEIELLLRLLKEVGHLQLETGIMRRVPRGIQGSISFGPDGLDINLIEKYDPEAARMLEQARDILNGEFEVVSDGERTEKLVSGGTTVKSGAQPNS